MHKTRLHFSRVHFEVEYIGYWSQKKWRLDFPSANNCQGQLLTSQSVSVLSSSHVIVSHNEIIDIKIF